MSRGWSAYNIQRRARAPRDRVSMNSLISDLPMGTHGYSWTLASPSGHLSREQVRPT